MTWIVFVPRMREYKKKKAIILCVAVDLQPGKAAV